MADYIKKIRTTTGDKEIDYEALANKPNSLPNPNKIKFTGGVVAEYDGSSEVTVDIPNGASEEQIRNSVNEYLDEHPVTSGATEEQATQIQTNTNNISELKGDLSQLSEEIGKQTGTGLSTEAIDKLEEVGNYLAYTTADGGSKWTELISILRNGSSGGGSGETVTLQSISATYTGGDVPVGTLLNDLTGITVTATYSDGSTSNVTGYTLSGEIVEGSNTITVSYGGKSTTFTVTGVAESGGNDSSEELMSESNIVATGYVIAKNVQYSFYQLGVKEGVNVYEIPVESGVTYEATITNNNQYGTPYWDDKTIKNANANTTFAISADKFTDFSTTGRVTVTLDGNTTIDTNMTTTPNGDGTYTRRITFTPAISGYLYTDNQTSVNGNIYSIKKVVV